MNKKIIYGIIVVVLVGIVLSLSGVFNKTDTETPVKIGLALPLTGGAAFLGESAQKAAELALKDAGQTKYTYELIFEDDAFTPSKTATVTNKFINIDKVLAFVTFGSGTSNAAAPINETAKVARFGLASDPTSAIGEYNFIHWTPAYKEGELLAKEIVSRGYKTVSIVDTNHSGTLAVTNSINKSLEGTDVQILSYDLTNVGDKDFRTIVTKIKGLNPGIVVLEMFSPEIEIMARQMKEQGVNIPLTSVETFEWSEEPSLFEGMWFVSDTILEDFSAHYNAEYGENPKPGATYTYDLVAMIINLQENSNKRIMASDLPNIIMKKGYDDSRFFGKTEIDADGFFVTEPSVKKIENDQVVLVK